MIAELFLVGLLLLLLFIFSSAETSLTAYSKPLMHQLEVEGDRRAARVNRLQQRKEKLLGAILLGNTLVQILASTVATSAAIALFGDAGVAYEAVVMTVVVLVLCEILPKTVALHHANRLSRFYAALMQPIVWMFGPLVLAVQGLVNGLLRLLRISTRQEDDLEAAMAELRGAIDIHTAEGEVQHERKMLRSILDLGDVEVGEIMIHRKNVVMLDGGQLPSAILDQVTASPYTRLPLWRDEPDNIVGILHSKALLRAVRGHETDLDGIDIIALCSPPWFIPDSTSLLDQLQEFRRRREHFALVVDEYGALQGIVTLEDILEEIVGDIADEHDLPVSGVRPQADGSFIVNGDVTLRDLNREYDWRLPDADAATIAGLLLHESRMIPEVGQVFLFYGFRFEVLRRVRNQITSIRLIPPAREEAEERA